MLETSYALPPKLRYLALQDGDALAQLARNALAPLLIYRLTDT